MRGVPKRRMLDTITIQQPSKTKTGKQPTIHSYSNVATSVACDIQDLTGDLRKTMLEKHPTATHQVHLKNSHTIKPDYILIDQENLRYVVLSINKCHRVHGFQILYVGQQYA